MLWFLVILLVVTIGIVVYIIQWAKKYLAQPYLAPSEPSRFSKAPTEVGPSSGRRRVFQTSKGPRVYEVDVHGLPIPKRVSVGA
jgi:hypothetical protein